MFYIITPFAFLSDCYYNKPTPPRTILKEGDAFEYRNHTEYSCRDFQHFVFCNSPYDKGNRCNAEHYHRSISRYNGIDLCRCFREE